MQIETTERDDVLVVKPIVDRLDSYVATEFRDAVAATIERGHGRLVLDLSEVEFVDSSGLGAIVTTQKKLGDARDLVICGANDAVLRLFKLARLDKILQIVADEKDALAALGSTS